MASKFIVCALVLFVQAISAQMVGNAFTPGMIGNNLATAEAMAGAFGPLAPNGLPLTPNGLPLAPNGLPLAPNGLPLAPNGLPLAPNGLPIEGAVPACGFGLTLAGLAANGGGFSVNSASPIIPNGVTVQSESLLFEGPLAVTGQMPFLGAVALEGPLPAAGQGAVAYGCGNGNIGMVSEDLNPGLAPVPNPAMAYNGMGPRGPYGPMY